MRLILTATVILFLALSATNAEAEIAVRLYRADATAQEGFTEVYKWRMGESDEWRRFQYLTETMKKGDKETISPFLNKPDELLVLSIKDPNGLTGKDYYLSKNGILISTILARHKYYEDAKLFYKLLKEEVTNQSSFEKFPGEIYPTDSKGIVARYWINQNLPNPSWLIDKQENVNLYDSFMRKLPIIHTEQSMYLNSFELKGNFILILNYPEAPGKFATIGPSGVRISTIDNEGRYLIDDKSYYDYFYTLTKENMRMKFDVQRKDRELEQRGNF
ncbi:MAG: hypothetical protein DI586_04010 [Micavibrio aeruginosavorus]|uniref:Uncharacterized protein n=1 Tax=Micavibrio aeruginosavorus TaxID=349221 RepID=A0A2W5FR94_9BACT|nr:MAG: hypothetical protein DI586_04010 [Micavibrio aeruginosavorus]